MKSLKKTLYAWISQKYMAGCSNYNSLAVRRSCRSKAQARETFARNNVPHARGLIFLNPWKAHQFAKEHGFPLVIKPNVSGFSRGSHFPITNFKELWKAVFWVKVWWPTSVVEQYLLGSNYRVLATPDELVSVIQRYPPFVDGNGQDSIDQLITAENGVRKEMGLHPTIYPIRRSPDVVRYLSRQQLTLDSVPSAGQRVHLFNRVALAPGGVVEIVDQSTITPRNAELFKQVVSMFDAALLGIDVIFERGIDIDFDQQRCIFLEVNSRPYTKMHDYPRYRQAEDLSAFYERMDQLAIPDTDTF
ncbi:MAG: cyanophycin synthetase [Gammaproteobacteria bacterium]|nr:cyanophycin synthetase [Gammaproteobacteria bacterium]